MASEHIETSATRTLPAGVSAEDFAKAVATPSTVTMGEISVSNRSVQDLIALDKHLRKYGATARRRNPLACVGIGRAIPPGPCD